MKGRVFVVGSLNADLTFRLDALPVAGETVLAEGLAVGPGGKGANQAVALARMGLPVTMVGAVGADAFGAMLRGRLAAEGVDTAALVVRGEDSGLAAILLQRDGQNAIVVSAGANARLQADDVEVGLRSLAAGDVVVVQLEVPLAVARHALRQARRAGALAVLDPAPASPAARALVGEADLVLPNRTEAAVLAGCAVDDWAAASQAARRLLELGARAAVVKLDRQGALYLGPEGEMRQAALPTAEVDSTAAGDAFLGGFVAARLEGHGVATALLWGARAGALAVARAGAQASLPRREEVVGAWRPT